MFRALTGRRTRSQRVAAVSPAGASVSDVNARADPMDDGASVESTTADRPPPDDDDDDDSSLGLGLTGAAAAARSRRSAREADNNGVLGGKGAGPSRKNSEKRGGLGKFRHLKCEHWT